MANKEITELTAAVTLAGTEEFPAQTGADTNAKVTLNQIRNYSAPRPDYVAGRWYQLLPPASQLANGSALGTGSIKLMSFWLFKTITISDLGCRITTLSAGGNVQLAIYASNATTFMPTGSPVAATGNIATDSAATVSADITGSNVTLQPGLYWMAVIADNATVALHTLSNSAAVTPMLVGSTTIANITSASLGLTHAHTFGTWPDLTSASPTEGALSAASGYVVAKAA